MIEVDQLTKEYSLGRQNASTLRESISNYFTSAKSRNQFLALDNISFKANANETIGIIGKNGAGKSTLLKVLSKITKPTSGTIKLYGRVSSLLEVGTGFHPELTGRENIYLNGSILGMTKKEVRSKFEEIVDFSGVAKFLDTPVKHYSSGMYVRLAFAVAAHLEPEILIVDEVLAVGDVDFQRKCLNKMQDVGNSGRTVIIVSHNMEAIERICDRAIVLDKGKISYDGNVSEAIKIYSGIGGMNHSKIWSESEAPGDETVRLRQVSVVDKNGNETGQIDSRHGLYLDFKFDVLRVEPTLHPAFHLFNDRGMRVFISGGFHHPDWFKKELDKGQYHLRCKIPGNLLAEGRYNAQILLTSKPISSSPFVNHVDLQEGVSFNVFDLAEGDSSRGSHVGPYPGIVRPKLEWEEC